MAFCAGTRGSLPLETFLTKYFYTTPPQSPKDKLSWVSSYSSGRSLVPFTEIFPAAPLLYVGVAASVFLAFLSFH